MPDNKQINYEMVTNPQLLEDLLNAMDTEADTSRTLINEIRADMGYVWRHPQTWNYTHDVAMAMGAASAAIKTGSAADYMIDGVNYKKAATDNFISLDSFSNADMSHAKMDVTSAAFRFAFVALDASGDDFIFFGAEAATNTLAKAERPAPADIPDGYCIVGGFIIEASAVGFSAASTGLDSVAISYWTYAYHPDLDVQEMYPRTITAATLANKVDRLN